MPTDPPPSPQSHGWIRFRGLRIEDTRVGVYPHERDHPRPIIVDLGVWGPVSRAADSDRLADSVNYDDLATLTTQICRERHYNLLETLCETIAAAILARFGDVDRIQLEIHKPGVGAGMIASVAVERGRVRRGNP